MFRLLILMIRGAKMLNFELPFDDNRVIRIIHENCNAQVLYGWF